MRGEEGFRLRGSGGRWCVIRAGDGARVTPWLSHPEIARNALERLARQARMRVRPCLRCGQGFASEGPHNRLCRFCRAACPGLPEQMLAVDGVVGR